MSNKILVGVTEKEYNKSPSIYEQAEQFNCLPLQPGQEEIARQIERQGIKHLILGVEDYTGMDIYKALKPGSAVVRHGIGYDGLNLEEATRRKILCANTPGTLKTSVAEHTVTLLLAAAKHLKLHINEIGSGLWSSHLGVELKNKTLAIIGAGNIGNEVARIAVQGFGMRVKGLKRNVDNSKAMKQEFGYSEITTDYGEVIHNTRFISLHLPATEQTANYLNAAKLTMLPTDAVVINTARGSLIDELALYDALSEGRLGGAALDVVRYEPYRPIDTNRDLRELSNVIMTPHAGSSTISASHRIAKRALANLAAVERGDYCSMDLLNPDVLKSIVST